KWDVRVSQYITHGAPAVGTKVTIVFRAVFFRPVGHGEFLRFDPPSQSILRIDEINSSLIPPGGGTWLLEDIIGGTHMTTRFNLKPSKWGFPGDALIALFAYIDTIRSLRKLRGLVVKLQKSNVTAEVR
ncbi:MAG TPA: hypothetical protein VFA55_09115, partial [Candidatus Kapabacteria bacterium]|nr:hypothetical protein [Candidatus Kapabacteria bacterium]